MKMQFPSTDIFNSKRFLSQNASTFRNNWSSEWVVTWPQFEKLGHRVTLTLPYLCRCIVCSCIYPFLYNLLLCDTPMPHFHNIRLDRNTFQEYSLEFRLTKGKYWSWLTCRHNLGIQSIPFQIPWMDFHHRYIDQGCICSQHPNR